MAIQINKGNRPAPNFRSTKHPEIIEALEEMNEGDWIDFIVPEDSKSSTIRNMIYRYSKVKLRDYKIKVTTRNENGVDVMYIKKTLNNTTE